MEVKEVKENNQLNLLLDVLNLLKEGKRPSQIATKLNISKQRLQYYLSSLKSKDLIQKIGYGTWEVKEVKTSKNSSQVAEVRGHGFMWKIKIVKPMNWKKRLEELKIPYKIVNGACSIMFKERKTWLASKNIIIYEPDSFMGVSACESKKYAVIQLLELLGALEKKLDINLKPYQFKVARSHYSLIKNCLAQQVNRTGQKIQISNQNGLWFLIDNSYNLNEAETVHPESSLIDNVGVQKYFNEHKETKFEVTPKFVLNSLNTVNNQMQGLIGGFDNYGVHIASHIGAIQSLNKGVRQLTKVMKGVLEENRQLKLQNKNQTTLGGFL